MAGGAAAYLGEPSAAWHFVKLARPIVVTCIHTYGERLLTPVLDRNIRARVEVSPTTGEVFAVSAFLGHRTDLESRDHIQWT